MRNAGLFLIALLAAPTAGAQQAPRRPDPPPRPAPKVEVPFPFEQLIPGYRDLEWDLEHRFRDLEHAFEYWPAPLPDVEWPMFDLPHVEWPSFEPLEVRFDALPPMMDLWNHPGAFDHRPFESPGFDFPHFDFQFDFLHGDPPHVEVPRFELPGSGMLWSPGQGRLPAPSLPEPGPDRGQDSPGDSLYRAARETLNRGEYRQAVELLQAFERSYPRSRYVPAAMYWQAFALYRVGADSDLRAAYGILARQRERFPEAAKENEVTALYTRVAGALAARGDAQAAATLREVGAAQAQGCDREEQSVRAEALSALVQSDPVAGKEILRRTLARRDTCSTSLRRRAVYLLARQNGADVTATLLSVAQTDPDPEVRREAIAHLGRREGDDAARALSELWSTDQDERTQRAILEALARRDTDASHQFLRRVIEQEAVSEALRAAAVRSLFNGRLARVSVSSPRGVTRVVPGARNETLSEADAQYLRDLYGRSSSRTIKTTVLELLGRAGDRSSDAWLLQLARNPNEETRYRSAAIRNLRRSDVPVADLSGLYDALAERDLRASIISVLGAREEDAATDKLFAIAKTGTDPYLRRMAVSALARKKDPRTEKLLLELVEP